MHDESADHDDAVGDVPQVEARAATLALLARRHADATVCPSEVARVLAAGAGRADDWRGEMAGVHAAVDALVADGAVRLSWKGVRWRCGAGRIGSGGETVRLEIARMLKLTAPLFTKWSFR